MADFAPHFYNALAQRPFNLEPMQQAAQTKAAAMQEAARNILASIRHSREMKLAGQRMEMEKTKYAQELELRKRESAAAEERARAIEHRTDVYEETQNKRWDTYLKGKELDAATREKLGLSREAGLNLRFGQRQAVGQAGGEAATTAVEQMLGVKLPPGMRAQDAAQFAKLIQKQTEDQQKQQDLQRHAGALGLGLKLRQDPDMNPVSTYTGSRVDVDPELQGIYAEGGPKALERHFASKGMTPEDAAAEAKAAVKPVDMPYVDPQKRAMFEAAMANNGIAGPDVENVSKYLFGRYKQSETEAHDALLKGFSASEPKARAAAKSTTPKIGLPSGGEYEDNVGFAKGGSVDDLIRDPQKHAWFMGAASASAQKDKRYVPQSAIDAALLSPGGKEAAQKLLDQNSDILHEHGENLLGRYGWTRAQAAPPAAAPPQSQPGSFGITPPGQAPPNPATPGPMPPGVQGGSGQDPVGAFRQRILSGEFGHSGNFDEERAKAELEKAGLKESDVMGAGGGG